MTRVNAMPGIITASMGNTIGAVAASFHEDIHTLVGPFTVRAVFEHAWHLEDRNGWILTVASVPYNGPLSIRLELSSLDGLHVVRGMHARLTEGVLYAGSVEISLDTAATWIPHVDDALLDSSFQNRVWADLSRLSAAVHGYRQQSTFGRDHIEGHTLGLRDALIGADEPAQGAHALGLLGFGPGLTPSGDDILCGLMVGLYVLGRRMRDCRPWADQALDFLHRAVEPAARTQTTALSRTILHYAARGVATEPLLDVLCSTGGGLSGRSMERLLAIGHSSGRDMLTGAILAVTAVMEREKARSAALAHQT